MIFVRAKSSVQYKNMEYSNKKELLSHQIYVTYKLALTFCENNEAHSTIQFRLIYEIPNIIKMRLHTKFYFKLFRAYKTTLKHGTITRTRAEFKICFCKSKVNFL